MSKELASLYYSGKFAHSERVLNFIVFWPYLTVFLFSLNIIWITLNIMSIFEKYKKIIHYWWAKAIILKTSIIKTCKFLWCTIIWLFYFNKSSKLLFLSLVTILKDLSRMLLIRLLDFLEQNIQIKGQSINCDLTMFCNKICLLFKSIKADICESAEIFWPAFLQILFIWPSKDNLLSIITPKIVSSLLLLNFLPLWRNVWSAQFSRCTYNDTYQSSVLYNFSKNQFVISLKSVWRFILANSRLFLMLYRLLSSAELLKKNCARNKTRSFINKSCQSGPSIDPCRTLQWRFPLN